jgi:hypothetical protein
MDEQAGLLADNCKTPQIHLNVKTRPAKSSGSSEAGCRRLSNPSRRTNATSLLGNFFRSSLIDKNGKAGKA